MGHSKRVAKLVGFVVNPVPPEVLPNPQVAKFYEDSDVFAAFHDLSG